MGAIRQITQSRLLVILAVLVLSAPVAVGQIVGRVTFGRIVLAENKKDQTSFSGSADGLRETGRVTTYTGNVTVSFPDSNVVLTADEVIYNGETKEMSLSGHITLKLDAR